MDVTMIEAYGNSTAIVDNLNNLLTFGSNTHGQLGIDEPIKSLSFENCYTSPQKANRSQILSVIIQLQGNGNTFGFLTKQNELYICGDFAIPIDKSRSESKGGILKQTLIRPHLAKFINEPYKGERFQIKSFAISREALAIVAVENVKKR